MHTKTVKDMKQKVLIFLFSVSALGTQAQDVLTLDDCIRETLSRNTSLRSADNDILMASERRQQVRTTLFPTVSASVNGMIANDDLVKLDLMGMSIGMVDKGVAASVSVMQPVYTGGQLTNANRLAALGEDVSRLQRNVTEADVRVTVETYYWQIVMLKEKLQTIDIIEKQVENVRKDAQNAVDAGIRNRNDLLQVQLKQNELRTTRIQLTNNLGVLKELLAQQMGRTDTFDIAFAVTDSLPAGPQSLYTEPTAALFQTSEYQLLGKQVEAEELNYKMVRGKNMPTVAVGGAYVYNNLMDKSASRLVGLVTVSVPISAWWGGKHEMRHQRLQIENAENTRRDTGERLVIRMNKAWNDMSDAYKQVSIAMESIAQSTENLRLNNDYYQFGTTTMSDLMEAQTLYQQSRDKYVEAYTQYEVKKREYLRATGR